MKKFPFKFSLLVIVLLSLVTIIFGASVVLNVINSVKFYTDTGTAVTYIVMTGLCLIMTVFSFGALIFGRYEIKNGKLYCRFGFICVKTDIKNIFQVTEFKTENKLVVYIVPEKYAVIVIKDKYYQEFYQALKKENPDLLFTTTDKAE